MGKFLEEAADKSANFATGGLVGVKDGKLGSGMVTNAVGAGGVADKALAPINKGLGGIGDAILGKKDPGTSDEVIDLADPYGRSLQNTALGEYGKYLNQDAGGMARTQTDNLNRQVRQDAEDQTRLAKQMVAQRGLGRSSLGLSAILGQSAGVGEKIGINNANEGLLKNQIGQQNLNFATGGINQILGEQGTSKIFKQGQASQGRQGGLAPLIGTAAGAYFGGPAGAKVGAGIGQAATQIG